MRTLDFEPSSHDLFSESSTSRRRFLSKTQSPLITPFGQHHYRRGVNLPLFSQCLQFESNIQMVNEQEEESERVPLEDIDNNALRTTQQELEQGKQENGKARVTRSRNRGNNEIEVFLDVASAKEEKVQRRGRKRMFGELQQLIVKHLQSKSMSRRQIQQFARKWAQKKNQDFAASNGWYEKFTNRLKKTQPGLIDSILKADNPILKKRKLLSKPQMQSCKNN